MPVAKAPAGNFLHPRRLPDIMRLSMGSQRSHHRLAGRVGGQGWLPPSPRLAWRSPYPMLTAFARCLHVSALLAGLTSHCQPWILKASHHPVSPEPKRLHVTLQRCRVNCGVSQVTFAVDGVCELYRRMLQVMHQVQVWSPVHRGSPTMAQH